MIEPLFGTVNTLVGGTFDHFNRPQNAQGGYFSNLGIFWHFMKHPWMIYWRCFLINSAKRKFKWSKIPKYGSKLLGGLGGLFGRDLDDDDAYAMYKREELEEGE